MREGGVLSILIDISSVYQREITMNWDQIEGKWKQVKGKVQERWGKLTSDDLDQLQGEREQLAGRLQELYGTSKEQINREIDDWAAKLKV